MAKIIHIIGRTAEKEIFYRQYWGTTINEDRSPFHWYDDAKMGFPPANRPAGRRDLVFCVHGDYVERQYAILPDPANITKARRQHKSGEARLCLNCFRSSRGRLSAEVLDRLIKATENYMHPRKVEARNLKLERFEAAKLDNPSRRAAREKRRIDRLMKGPQHLAGYFDHANKKWRFDVKFKNKVTGQWTRSKVSEKPPVPGEMAVARCRDEVVAEVVTVHPTYYNTCLHCLARYVNDFGPVDLRSLPHRGKKRPTRKSNDEGSEVVVDATVEEVADEPT